MARALVLTGGFPRDHNFSTTGPLVAALATAGLETEVSSEVDEALAGLSARDDVSLLVTNVLRWTMTASAYAPFREQYGFSPAPPARAGFEAHLRRGGGVLAMHTSVISFDDWPEWSACLGARWLWGVSGHPPVGPLHVEVAAGAHTVVEDAASFDLVDELYGGLELAQDVVPLAWGRVEEDHQPVLWARRHGHAAVVTDLLGHDLRSYESAAHVAILGRAARWLVGPDC